MEAQCKSCKSKQIGVDGGERVCYGCGRVQGPTYDHEMSAVHFCKKNTYKRIFYFNERVTRWGCVEPTIHPTIWGLIKKEATKRVKYGDLENFCNRKLVGIMLRNVKINAKISHAFRSKKFKKQPLTKKRFYDKYFEKWKTIRWKLTGLKPITPSQDLIERMKQLFIACQIPFEMFRHAGDCDKRKKCYKYYYCMHNFINYDLTMRWLLQICEHKHGFDNCYALFKDEFPLISKKVIDKKLRPVFEKICIYNDWPIPTMD